MLLCPQYVRVLSSTRKPEKLHVIFQSGKVGDILSIWKSQEILPKMPVEFAEKSIGKWEKKYWKSRENLSVRKSGNPVYAHQILEDIFLMADFP